MTHFLIYTFEVSICIASFYAVFLLFFNNDTFYKLKRYYLLFTVFTSLLIPQIRSDQTILNYKRSVIKQDAESIDISKYNDTFTIVMFGKIPEQINTGQKSKSFPYILIFSIIYFFGLLVILFKLINNINEIILLARKHKKTAYKNYWLVELPENYPSFSFFKYIFINTRNLNNEDREDIILHEELHVKQRHSMDIILIELMKVLFWFNPAIWYLKKSLIKTHECLADEYVLKKESDKTTNYQSLLLKQYLSNINIELAHPFNYSLIKFRIKMMTKNKSKWWARYKLIFALPVLTLAFVAFTNARKSSKSLGNSIDFDPQPWGMVFIPQGELLLSRTDGTTTKEISVSFDAFWMRETEVTVGEYNKYLESVKKDSIKQVYEAALPDNDKAPFNGYFVNETYENYPIVGISFIQAQNYCKWMTNKENQKLKNEGKSPGFDFRIPYEVEWTWASFGGINQEDIVKPIIPELMEIKRGKDIKNDINDFGLIFMFSNVSEWTYTAFDNDKYLTDANNDPQSENDMIVVLGNNYKNNNPKKLTLDGSKGYDYVGFRYVRTYKGKTN
ncbi:MAG: SUMF1/EgtB/PvdO family nonheme iron enzyme [Bacteroidales bacterium]|nr:SUMF1/EgtB/PvdO family nonheme iron enzyme [Bacteroidales bacterium]